jgi:hypothetical protein
MGSAVGDPMLYPDVPLLHGFAVVTGVLVMERVLAAVARRSERAEAFIHGVPHQVVDEGRIDLKGTAIESMPREELLSELRVAGIEQLGQVKRAFLEESAKISVFRYAPDDVRPGLPLVPPWDIKRPEGFGKDEVVTPDGYYSCAQCGETRFRRSGENFGACPHCDDNGEWMVASAAGVAGTGQVAGNTGSD